MRGEWDCWGAALVQFKMTLALSPFISSKLYTGGEVLENSVAAWYLLLIDFMDSCNDVRQRGCETFSSAQTTRNLLCVCANSIERAARQSAEIPFHPNSCMEDACERHFGQIKAASSVTTLKTALLATQRKKMPMVTPCFLPEVSQRGVQEIGEQAFRSALLFNEVATGCRAAETEKTLRDWWESVGKSILVRPRVQQPVFSAGVFQASL